MNLYLILKNYTRKKNLNLFKNHEKYTSFQIFKNYASILRVVGQFDPTVFYVCFYSTVELRLKFKTNSFKVKLF